MVREAKKYIAKNETKEANHDALYQACKAIPRCAAGGGARTRISEGARERASEREGASARVHSHTHTRRLV